MLADILKFRPKPDIQICYEILLDSVEVSIEADSGRIGAKQATRTSVTHLVFIYNTTIQFTSFHRRRDDGATLKALVGGLSLIFFFFSFSLTSL